jgi:hypothetical protein
VARLLSCGQRRTGILKYGLVDANQMHGHAAIASDPGLHVGKQASAWVAHHKERCSLKDLRPVQKKNNQKVATKDKLYHPLTENSRSLLNRPGSVWKRLVMTTGTKETEMWRK